MAQVEQGTKAIDFTYDTQRTSGLTLSETVKSAEKTVVYFSRYFGCTACKVEMHDIKAEYEKFKQKNAQVLVVLQSPASTVTGAVGEDFYPFDIVCDPEMKLHPLYELPPAGSKEQMVTAADTERMDEMRKKAVENRLAHGAYEGEELQLPGLFILDKEMNVLYARRAKTLFDLPTVEQVIEML